MVVTTRDCPARLVPVGTPITIPKDTFVTITQDLGGNYTVTVNGNMARIDRTDADALGYERFEMHFEPPKDDSIDVGQVWEALRTVYDPEIPVNIVDLGLIYEVSVDAASGKARIVMTLTAPGCGMGPVLLSDVEYRICKVPNVKSVDVELVFDPAWSRERMSDEARLATGMFY